MVDFTLFGWVGSMPRMPQMPGFQHPGFWQQQMPGNQHMVAPGPGTMGGFAGTGSAPGAASVASLSSLASAVESTTADGGDEDLSSHLNEIV